MQLVLELGIDCLMVPLLLHFPLLFLIGKLQKIRNLVFFFVNLSLHWFWVLILALGDESERVSEDRFGDKHVRGEGAVTLLDAVYPVDYLVDLSLKLVWCVIFEVVLQES